MKEIRTSGPLMFSDPNCPTRVGEIINTISEIYDIPNPSEGMQVYVRDEKKTYTITGLKEAVIGGERVPDAKVDTFEAVKSQVEEINNDFAEMREALINGSFVVGIAKAVKAGAVTFEMLDGKLQLSASVVDDLETANTLKPLSANQGKVLKELIDIINGTGEGSTDKKITDAIAALVDRAPENLDTLRELAEWITVHGAKAAEMLADIKANADNLAETKKDIANQLFTDSTADKVSITGRNEQSMRINFSAEIIAATTENAGVMSAEDKKRNDFLSQYSDVVSRIDEVNVPFEKIGALQQNGEVLYTTTYGNTGFIYTNNDTLVELYVQCSSSDCVLFYDENQEVISDLTIVGDGVMTKTIDLSTMDYVDVKSIVVNHRRGGSIPGYVKVKRKITYAGRIKDVENALRGFKPKDSKIMAVGGNTFNINGYIGKTGTTSISDDYLCSDYLTLNKDNPLIIVGGYAGESSLLVAFYDENKVFISGKNNATEAVFAPTDYPANAVFYRCGTKSTYKDTIYFVNQDILTLQKQIESLSNIDLSELNDLKSQVETFKSKPFDLTIDGYTQPNGLFATTENARRTDYIAVNTHNKLDYCTKISNTGLAVAFYDEEKVLLTDLNILGLGAEYNEGTIDFYKSEYKDVRYVIVSYYDKDKVYENYKFILYTDNSWDVPLQSLEKRVANIEKTSPDKNGLNILIFGDSITTCANFTYENAVTTSYTLKKNSNSYTDKNGNTVRYSMWPYLLTEIFSCEDVRNYAQAGASFKDAAREAGSERLNLSYQIDMAINDIENPNGAFPTVGAFVPDIVIFALGTNDGEPNDTYDNAMAKTIMDGDNFDVDATIANLDWSNFNEAARAAFMRVHKHFPYAQKFCVLPIQRQAREQLTGGVNDDLKKMAERYSIVVIDGATELGVVRDFEKKSALGLLLKDGLHPNDVGQRLFARMVARYIKQFVLL